MDQEAENAHRRVPPVERDLERHVEIVDALKQVCRVVAIHAVVRALCLSDQLLLLCVEDLRVRIRALTRCVEHRQESDAIVPED